MPGVKSAGAIKRSIERVTPVLLSDSPIPVSAITPGFVRLLGAHLGSSGLLAGPEVLEAVGARFDLETTGRGEVHLAGSFEFPSDGRSGDLRWALLSPSPARGAFDECWIDIWPADTSLKRVLYATLVPGDSHASAPEVTQINSRLGVVFDADKAIRSRSTAVFPSGCGAIGFALGIVVVFLRRLEFASALHAGISRRGLLGISLLETSAWVGLAAAAALAAGVIASSTLAEGRDLVIQGAVRTVIVSTFGSFAGSLLALGFIRESRLYSYFKSRS
ncbi:hypothetical protein [Leifsonia sp. fls2-241-R2A-40a]|uniref:hypothetical protein n=1 Tax=Leifsonia sp. fls2-241-R2A-40a TaxID=3040290 RepID=UPI00254A6490|nr:hypothetical protein [Leifsonia sp. fls2-241-R2A-40a]